VGRPRKQIQKISPDNSQFPVGISSIVPILWNEVLEAILSHAYSIERREITEGQLALMLLRRQAWEIALHWLIKGEWDKKHKIPCKPSKANGYKPKGRHLQSLFLLCERCHAFQAVLPEVTIPYPHAAHWFGHVYWEHVFCDIHGVFYPDGLPLKGAKKEAAIALRQDELRTHRSLENPLQPDSWMKASYQIFEVATFLAETSTQFKEKYYDKFISAYAAENKQLENPNFARFFIEDGKAYYQSGKGRGKIYHPLPPEMKAHFEKMNFIILT
jgi:hypothetical protein